MEDGEPAKKIAEVCEVCGVGQTRTLMEARAVM